jgi:ankyrin repeat protein
MRSALDPEVVEQRLEHGDLEVQAQRLGRPLAIREARAEPVVADDVVAGSECFEEPAEAGRAPVLHDVADPPGRQDERPPGADACVRNARTVELEEARLLLHAFRLRVAAAATAPSGLRVRWVRVMQLTVEQACERFVTLAGERGGVVDGTVALHHALDYERLEPVRLLLGHGGDPNESREWPALHHAVARGRSPEFVRVLVRSGADPRARDGNGRTAYQHAIRRGRGDVARALEQLGSPTEVDASDRALHAIAAGGEVDAAALDEDAPDVLIELAMSDVETLARVVDAVGPMFGAQWGGPRDTLLHQAAWFGRVELVELLLRRGADPSAEVETEYATPLGWAAVGSRYTPDHPNDSFSARDADYVGVARLLVAGGAEIAVKDAEMAAPPLSVWLMDALERHR